LLVQNIATVIAGLVIAFQACWQLSFIVLALAPLLGLNGYVQVKVLKGFSADAKVHENVRLFNLRESSMIDLNISN
jgi:ATP-binding cassette subfamily B (MDR/TAP) protein 1